MSRTALGRPITHMVRGHDIVDERWATYRVRSPPVLTTVALSRQLPRESFGPYERVQRSHAGFEEPVPEVHDCTSRRASYGIFPVETESDVSDE